MTIDVFFNVVVAIDRKERTEEEHGEQGQEDQLLA